MSELDRIKHKDDQIAFLWSLLDDISSAGDMLRPEISNYFKYVNKKCEERSLVANSFDGQTLEINEGDYQNGNNDLKIIQISPMPNNEYYQGILIGLGSDGVTYVYDKSWDIYAPAIDKNLVKEKT